MNHRCLVVCVIVSERCSSCDRARYPTVVDTNRALCTVTTVVLFPPGYPSLVHECKVTLTTALSTAICTPPVDCTAVDASKRVITYTDFRLLGIHIGPRMVTVLTESHFHYQRRTRRQSGKHHYHGVDGFYDLLSVIIGHTEHRCLISLSNHGDVTARRYQRPSSRRLYFVFRVRGFTQLQRSELVPGQPVSATMELAENGYSTWYTE